MDIGCKLKSLRIAKGWSRVQLADKLGCGSSTITHWENGTRVPTISTLSDIAKVFGVPVEFFIAEEDTKPDYLYQDSNSPELAIVLEYAKKADKSTLLMVASILEKLVGDKDEK